jgi:hypothetical protein
MQLAPYRPHDFEVIIYKKDEYLEHEPILSRADAGVFRRQTTSPEVP